MPVTNDGFSMALSPPEPALLAEAATDEPATTQEAQSSDLNDAVQAKIEERSSDSEEQTSEDESEQTSEDEEESSEEERTFEDDEDDDAEPTVEYSGGGYFLVTHADGSTDKVRGRSEAYTTAGIPDPEEDE